MCAKSAQWISHKILKKNPYVFAFYTKENHSFKDTLSGRNTLSIDLNAILSGRNELSERTKLLEDVSRYKKTISRIQTLTETIQKEYLPNTLQKLHSKTRDYSRNLITDHDYAYFLGSLAVDEKIPLKNYPAIYHTLKEAKLKENIELDRVNEDIARLMSLLEKRLTRKELSSLLDAESVYKKGEITPFAYFSQLKEITFSLDISLKRYAYLYSYIEYLTFAQETRVLSIHKELHALHNDLLDTILSREKPAIRMIEARTQTLKFFCALFTLNPPHSNWQFYTENKSLFDSRKLAYFLRKESRALLERPSLSINDVMAITMMDHSYIDMKKIFVLLPDVSGYLGAALEEERLLMHSVINTMNERKIKNSIIIVDSSFLDETCRAFAQNSFSYIVLYPAHPKPKRSGLFPSTMILKSR